MLIMSDDINGLRNADESCGILSADSPAVNFGLSSRSRQAVGHTNPLGWRNSWSFEANGFHVGFNTLITVPAKPLILSQPPSRCEKSDAVTVKYSISIRSRGWQPQEASSFIAVSLICLHPADTAPQKDLAHHRSLFDELPFEFTLNSFGGCRHFWIPGLAISRPLRFPLFLF